jgi:hypothetical protein
MKRILTATLFFLLGFSLAFAQNQKSKVTLNLVDATENKPVAFASVYVTPKGDTTATNFCLSGENGKAVLADVKVGTYKLTVTYTGYETYEKEYKFSNKDENLGTIKLVEAKEQLNAATVSAVGNPIVVKKDTIEFVATAFKVSEHAMLEDLLKKLPGIDIDDDGNITFNGEKVDKITVGDKTFFADNQLTMKNLPAYVVDKIKVIDKEKDDAKFSGIATSDDKEKVIDIKFKKEFMKGWFGNSRLGGGYKLTPKEGSALVDDQGVLFSGNAMATIYTEEDQLVFMGNATNSQRAGSTTGRAGINFNTDRIKGVESNANVSYNYRDNNSKRVSSRTTFQSDGTDLYTNGDNMSNSGSNSVSGNVEFRTKMGRNNKYFFNFRPTITYTDSHSSSSSNSSTSNDSGVLNSSSSLNSSNTQTLATTGNFSGGIRNMGKQNRSLTVSFNYNFSDANGMKRENSETVFANETTIKDLIYDTDSDQLSLRGNISYTEPLSTKWAIQSQFTSSFSKNKSNSKATNAIDGTYNDYYSSYSNSKNLNESLRLLFQYSNNLSFVQFGGQAQAYLNEVVSQARSVETVTGKDEWIMKWSPFANYFYRGESSNFNANYNFTTNAPSSSNLTPNLDISNPVQLRAGNIYLKPSYNHRFNTNFRTNNRVTFSYFNVGLNANMTSKSIVNASWNDKDGVRYTVPVNSQKPQMSTSLNLSYNTPIGAAKKIFFTVGGNGSYSRSTTYQAMGRLEGIDTDTFDYNTFMENFWGNAAGDKFYSGQSGFGESLTNSFNYSFNAQFRYTLDKFEVSIAGRANNRIAKYSLDPTANVNTWTNNISNNILYRTNFGLELVNVLTYRFYIGYSDGYGTPEWRWNMTLTQNIKKVNMSLQLIDILNKTRSLNRNETAEYIEDVYTNVLGRRIMFTIGFNFGKIDRQMSNKANRAVRQFNSSDRGGFGGGNFGGGMRGGMGGGMGRGR